MFRRGPGSYSVSEFAKTFGILIFFFFEAGFICVTLAKLEVTLQSRLTFNSEIYLPLPSNYLY